MFLLLSIIVLSNQNKVLGKSAMIDICRLPPIQPNKVPCRAEIGMWTFDSK